MPHDPSPGQDHVAAPGPPAPGFEPDRMRAILRAMPDLVWFKDPAGVYRGVNARAEAYYGLPEDRIVGHTDEELSGPEVAAQFRARDLAAIEARAPVVAYEWLTFADGHVELNETTKTPIYADDGTLLGVMGIGHDITAQHRAEAGLREQEERFKAIFEGSADAIALIDRELHFVQVNQAACAALGYTEAELQAMVVWDIDPVMTRERLDGILAAAGEAGGGRFQTRHRRRDGELRDVEVSVRFIRIGSADFQLALWRDITDELRRQRDLAASERLLQQAQEISAVGSWTWDPATGLTTASAEAMRIYGLREPPGDLWMTLEHVVAAEDLSILREQMTRLVTGEDATAVSYRIVVDGETRWIESMGRAQRAEDGTVERVVGISQDVTRTRQAARDRLAMEARYHTLFDTAAVSIMLHDPETGATIDANARALEAYGVGSVAELDATRVFAAAAPYSVADALAYIRRALAEGRQRFEWCSVNVHGTEFWEDVILEPVQLNGRTVVMSVASDVTDRKVAEQELEFHRRHLEDMVSLRTAELAAANRRLTLSDLRLKSMLDLSTRADLLDEKSLLRHGLEEAVRLTGSRIGYVHFVNDDETIELVTWSRETLAQCDAVFDTHYPISAAGVWADSARYKKAVVHNDWEATPDRKGLPDGHIPLQRHLGVPVVDRGHVRMLLGVGNKEAPYDQGDADELSLVGQDLYRIAMRRRAEIALEHAKEAAEAASRAKTTFLANMSHEIRTPMNAIIGLTHLMRSEPVAPRQEERLANIAENAEHLLKILNDVLDLSKIEAGKLALEPSDFSLTDVLEHLRSIEAEQAGAKGLRLTMTVAPDVPTALHGDGLRLAQVLVNLVNNAIKFTAMGGVDLVIGRRPDLGPDVLRFTVRDSGIGIAPHDLERLFGSFEQADASTTRRFGGSGLGLSICRSLVELMGGTITVESRLGEGSAFSVDVPLPPADLAASPQFVAARPPSQKVHLQERAAAAARPGAHVLLVEDVATNRSVASEMLRLLGVEVDLAADGREAVEAASARRYDLVLMDVQMPILDGMDATREIRRLPDWADVPIIAMTANAFEEDRQDCLAAGMNDHLPKPVDPDRLYATVERWIPRRAGSLAAAARPKDGPGRSEAASAATLMGTGDWPTAGPRGAGAEPDGLSAATRAAATPAMPSPPSLPPGLVPTGPGLTPGAPVVASSAGTVPASAGPVDRPQAPATSEAATTSEAAAPGRAPVAGAAAGSAAGPDARPAAAAPASASASAPGNGTGAPVAGGPAGPGRERDTRAVRDAIAALPRPTLPGGPDGRDLIASIASIEGVDAAPWRSAGAAARTSYLGLLAGFVAAHGGDGDALRARLAAGERGKARRMARTLEHLGAGLGLAGLERAAADAGTALEDPGATDVEARVGALADVLAALVAELDRAGLGDPDATAAGASR